MKIFIAAITVTALGAAQNCFVQLFEQSPFGIPLSAQTIVSDIEGSLQPLMQGLVNGGNLEGARKWDLTRIEYRTENQPFYSQQTEVQQIPLRLTSINLKTAQTDQQGQQKTTSSFHGFTRLDPQQSITQSFVVDLDAKDPIVGVKAWQGDYSYPVQEADSTISRNGVQYLNFIKQLPPRGGEMYQVPQTYLRTTAIELETESGRLIKLGQQSPTDKLVNYEWSTEDYKMLGLETREAPIRYIQELDGVKIDVEYNTIEFVGVSLVSRQCIWDWPPEPPTSVRITDLTPQQASISWNKPIMNGAKELYEYSVLMSDCSGDQQSYSKVACPTQASDSTKCTISMQTILTRVQLGCQLRVKVDARTDYGWTGPSLKGEKLLAFAPLKPENLRDDPLKTSNTIVGLQWNEPKSCQGSDCTGYNIQCRPGVSMINECGDLVNQVAATEKGAFQSIANMLNPSQLKHSFSSYPSGWEVLYGHAYECRIQACNNLGCSEWSLPTTVVTAAAPEPPTNVQIVNSCEKACPVSVTWLAPKYESKITGYLVLVSDPTSKDFKTTNCYSANGWIDHCCLDEEAFGFGSTLALQVVAQSNQGNSIPSEIATLSLICPPSRPLQVRCTQQENAVSLNWNPPEHENGSQVTSFNVWQKAPQESSFTLIRSNIVQRELSLEFQGDLNYSFRVQPFSAQGLGEISDSAICLPSPVQKVVEKEDNFWRWFLIGLLSGLFLTSLLLCLSFLCCPRIFKDQSNREEESDMPILTQENEPKIGAVHDNQPQAANFEIEDDYKPKALGQNRISVTQKKLEDKMRQRLEYQTKVRESVLPSEVLRRSIREAEPWEIERLQAQSLDQTAIGGSYKQGGPQIQNRSQELSDQRPPRIQQREETDEILTP